MIQDTLIPLITDCQTELIVAAVLNIALSLLMVSASNRVEYDHAPAYRRSRRLTSLSLAVFGIGFALHALFPRADYGAVVANAITLTYFHIGGLLLSMSHTSLVMPRYLTRRVVLRDGIAVGAALVCYLVAVVMDVPALLNAGAVVSLMHMVWLTAVFYRSFHRMYTLLAAMAEYTGRDNYTDDRIRGMYFSCHLIILFGVVNIAFSPVVHTAFWLFSIMLVLGMCVFTYIYKALDDYGMNAAVAEEDIRLAEEWLATDDGKRYYDEYMACRRRWSPLSDFSILTGFFRQW